MTPANLRGPARAMEMGVIFSRAGHGSGFSTTDELRSNPAPLPGMRGLVTTGTMPAPAG
ncbi:hypothetical protein [Paraburkholderia terrae]|uniref:Terephthalate dihydrodiol dehydrogenase n=1 Tax=Paraburkholderia terrae TaxID=311230 RepID=A0A2I8EU49_9BURK|nr:hypothetical protein [Paraburkholderia terrae]AUT63163.1 terephthalate dihydrodiol dehydrogenase [Paraburkholderia terrae]